MGGRWSRRKTSNTPVISGGGSIFAPRSLNEALLHTYKQNLNTQELHLQFSSNGKALKRFWLCNSLVDKEIFLHILSYMRGPELMTCTEINKVWFDCAATNWLWDAVDGIYGMEDVSMGRYDYRCRHLRMRLTREEKRRHRARIAGMEIEEHREKTYTDSKVFVKQETVNQAKKKAFGCVVNVKKSASQNDYDYDPFVLGNDKEVRLL